MAGCAEMLLYHRSAIPVPVFAPDAADMDPLELLEQLAEFVMEPDFRAKRRVFHEERRQLFEEGVPDKTAVEEMNQLAADYARATNARDWRNRSTDPTCFAARRSSK